MRKLTVAEWMTKKLTLVKPMDSLARAREVMVEKRINQLPVIAKGRLVGIVTDRDLRDAFPSALEGGRKDATLDETTVESVMTPNVRTLSPTDDLVQAAELMRSERIGAIPVVEDDALVGIVTRSDVLAAFVELARS